MRVGANRQRRLLGDDKRVVHGSAALPHRNPAPIFLFVLPKRKTAAGEVKKKRAFGRRFGAQAKGGGFLTTSNHCGRKFQLSAGCAASLPRRTASPHCETAHEIGVVVGFDRLLFPRSPLTLSAAAAVNDAHRGSGSGGRSRPSRHAPRSRNSGSRGRRPIQVPGFLPRPTLKPETFEWFLSGTPYLPLDGSRRFSFPPGAAHFLLPRQKKKGGAKSRVPAQVRLSLLPSRYSVVTPK